MEQRHLQGLPGGSRMAGMDATAEPQVVPQAAPQEAPKKKHGGDRGVPRDPKTGRLLPKVKPEGTPAALESVVDLPESDAHDHLEAMRHVCSVGASQDKTPLQKACRAWMNDTPGTFIAAKTRLEEAALKAASTNAAGDVGKKPDGEPIDPDAALLVARKWLEDHDDGRA